MPASTPASSPLPEKNQQPLGQSLVRSMGQPGHAVSGMFASLEKALEAGQSLRREDYLRLFVTYYRQSQTRQDQGYGLSQPPLPS